MSIAKFIDHAVLHPTQTDDDVREGCRLCDALSVASICVKPYAVSLAAELLASSEVKVSTVIGFPSGGLATAIKAAEARLACQQGAVELDMVANNGKALAGDWNYVTEDIRGVVDVGREFGAITKVIFETGYLTDDVKIQLCQCSERAGAAFVKTSTGFGFVKQPDGSMKSTGATEHDIQLMREHCSESVQVKASGGIRGYADARRFIDLGATRLGTSSTQTIVDQEQGAATRDSDTGY